MTGAAFMAGLALALVLWRWDRTRDDRNLAEVRRDPGRGRVHAGRPQLSAEGERIALRRSGHALLDRFAAWCAGPRRLVLLAPLPIGVCLLPVGREVAGLVFLLGVPLAALYLAVVTRGASPGDDA
jgi:hypothetical protein